jgi:hypothetical protein
MLVINKPLSTVAFPTAIAIKIQPFESSAEQLKTMG